MFSRRIVLTVVILSSVCSFADDLAPNPGTEKTFVIQTQDEVGAKDLTPNDEASLSYVPGEIIVKFREDVSNQIRQDIVSKESFSQIRMTPSIHNLNHYCPVNF